MTSVGLAGDEPLYGEVVPAPRPCCSAQALIDTSGSGIFKAAGQKVPALLVVFAAGLEERLRT